MKKYDVYEELIEALTGMAHISRPRTKKSEKLSDIDRLQHGICDLMEDAAVAIDDLLRRVSDEGRQVTETA
jgi:hypothetical protein